VNIIDYAGGVFQEYVIDCEKFNRIRDSEDYSDMDFETLMSYIGILGEEPVADSILSQIEKHSSLFNNRNTGFLVVLSDISSVLKNIMADERFLEDLGWLLPVPFRPELSDDGYPNKDLFVELSQVSDITPDTSPPAKAYRIFYNGSLIYRPLTPDMLRTYLCKSNFELYAVCVHTFSNQKIELKRSNSFSGIRIYVDNMLLCDENELIPALQHYGLTKHGNYELIQSVRGIGAMIYITDKQNITANARRTFIDVTDYDSLQFLSMVGEFVDNVYQARYALSRFESAKRRGVLSQEKMDDLREKARQSLIDLARSDISVEAKEHLPPMDFKLLPPADQRRLIKNVITKDMNAQIKKYLSLTDAYDPDTCFIDFKAWLSASQYTNP
jgi:hypothetical protein